MGNPDLELQNPDRDPPRRRRRDAANRRCRALAAIILLTVGVCGLLTSATTAMPSLLRLLRVQPCLGTAVQDGRAAGQGALGNEASSLQSVAGGKLDVFVQRRDALAKALETEGVDAFIVEPGPSFAYYANISQADWEAFAPSQRPLLLVIQPSSKEDAPDRTAVSRTTLLAPGAQADRARALLRRTTPGAEMVTWAPRWNPYATLRRSRLFAPIDARASEGIDQRPVVVVDPATRALIVDNLGDAGFRYRRPGGAVARLVTPQ